MTKSNWSMTFKKTRVSSSRMELSLANITKQIESLKNHSDLRDTTAYCIKGQIKNTKLLGNKEIEFEGIRITGHGVQLLNIYPLPNILYVIDKQGLEDSIESYRNVINTTDLYNLNVALIDEYPNPMFCEKEDAEMTTKINHLALKGNNSYWAEINELFKNDIVHVKLGNIATFDIKETIESLYCLRFKDSISIEKFNIAFSSFRAYLKYNYTDWEDRARILDVLYDIHKFYYLNIHKSVNTDAYTTAGIADSIMVWICHYYKNISTELLCSETVDYKKITDLLFKIRQSLDKCFTGTGNVTKKTTLKHTKSLRNALADLDEQFVYRKEAGVSIPNVELLSYESKPCITLNSDFGLNSDGIILSNHDGEYYDIEISIGKYNRQYIKVTDGTNLIIDTQDVFGGVMILTPDNLFYYPVLMALGSHDFLVLDTKLKEKIYEKVSILKADNENFFNTTFCSWGEMAKDLYNITGILLTDKLHEDENITKLLKHNTFEEDDIFRALQSKSSSSNNITRLLNILMSKDIDNKTYINLYRLAMAEVKLRCTDQRDALYNDALVYEFIELMYAAYTKKYSNSEFIKLVNDYVDKVYSSSSDSHYYYRLFIEKLEEHDVIFDKVDNKLLDKILKDIEKQNNKRAVLGLPLFEVELAVANILDDIKQRKILIVVSADNDSGDKELLKLKYSDDNIIYVINTNVKLAIQDRVGIGCLWSNNVLLYGETIELRYIVLQSDLLYDYRLLSQALKSAVIPSKEYMLNISKDILNIETKLGILGNYVSRSSLYEIASFLHYNFNTPEVKTSDTEPSLVLKYLEQVIKKLEAKVD